ncbi:hypothetical protein RIF29_29199 [Crotalaria pallida]|uniref:Uncharacterized protein n=1 Tax=Crotalaria pallida TaxID=3830 RepID=A0AAN9EJB8_CROPI
MASQRTPGALDGSTVHEQMSLAVEDGISGIENMHCESLAQPTLHHGEIDNNLIRRSTVRFSIVDDEEHQRGDDHGDAGATPFQSQKLPREKDGGEGRNTVTVSDAKT